MTNVRQVIARVSNDTIIVNVEATECTLCYVYDIVKETLAYRPVGISTEEAKKLDLGYNDAETGTEFTVTDINGNSFKVVLDSITYIGV